MKPHTFSTLFCDFVLILPHPFAAVTTTSGLFAALLRPSQLVSIFTTLFNGPQSFSSLPTSQLFSLLTRFSQLFSTTLASAHLFSTLLTSCHLFSTLPTASHLRSTDLTSFSAHLNSCHLLSTLLNSCQLFSPLFTEMLHTGRLLHTEAFTQRRLYTQQAFTQKKLLHTEAFTQSKLLHLVRTKATQIAAPKPDDLDAKAEKRRF